MTQPYAGHTSASSPAEAEPAETAEKVEPAATGQSPEQMPAQTHHDQQEEHEEHEDHGHSVAAWTAVTVILFATLIMSLAVVFPSVLWFVVGAVLVVVGMIAGKVLAMAGYGQKVGTYEAADRQGRADLPGRNQHNSGTQ